MRVLVSSRCGGGGGGGAQRVTVAGCCVREKQNCVISAVSRTVHLKILNGIITKIRRWPGPPRVLLLVPLPLLLLLEASKSYDFD